MPNSFLDISLGVTGGGGGFVSPATSDLDMALYSILSLPVASNIDASNGEAAELRLNIDDVNLIGTAELRAIANYAIGYGATGTPNIVTAASAGDDEGSSFRITAFDSLLAESFLELLIPEGAAPEFRINFAGTDVLEIDSTSASFFNGVASLGAPGLTLGPTGAVVGPSSPLVLTSNEQDLGVPVAHRLQHNGGLTEPDAKILQILNGTTPATHEVFSIAAGGGLNLKRRAYAASATTQGEAIAAVTDTSAARTITLATADVALGRHITVKDESGGAGTNNITVATEGAETIDGAASITINADYGVARLYSDGVNWFSL